MTTIGWIGDLNVELKQSLDRTIKVPEGGRVSFMLKLVEPQIQFKQWPGEQHPKKSFVWSASDGRVLHASEKLSFEITEALKPYTEKISLANASDVLVEIQNKGTKNKPVWFVAVVGGI